MFATEVLQLWTLLAKKLTEEASKEDLEVLKLLENRYPEISYRANLFMKWWYLDKVRELTAQNE